MQGSPLGKLEVAFVANSSTQKVVANMEVDRGYNACKALDPQIDNEDDVQHSSPRYEINEQELQMQMWLGGLHGCNDWAGRTRGSGLVAALYGRGGLADGRTSGYGSLDGADWGGRGGLADRRMGRTIESWTGRIGADRADGADWGGRGGLGRTGRTWPNGADYAITDGADWGGRGGLGRTGADCGGLGRTGADGADWGGRCGRGGRRRIGGA